MIHRRRAPVLAILAFLLALVPATSSARAQLVRWLELDADPAVSPRVGVRMVQGTYGGRFIKVLLLAPSVFADARFVGAGGVVSLKDKLIDRKLSILELNADLVGAAPGWVAVDDAIVEAEFSAEQWRGFLAAEALLDVIKPPADDNKPVRWRSNRFFKLLVHRKLNAGAPAITRPVGQQLELVPLADPTAVVGNLLPVQLLFRGKPLPATRIYALSTEAPAGSSATSDAEGKASLRLERGRTYVISAVKVEPAQDVMVIFIARLTLPRL